MNLWCDNQMIHEGKIICSVHLIEARVLNCPYENNDKRLESKYPCSDYKRRILNEK